jgi:hypothetical protein
MASPRRFLRPATSFFFGFHTHTDNPLTKTLYSENPILLNALDQTFRAVAHKAAPPRL